MARSVNPDDRHWREEGPKVPSRWVDAHESGPSAPSERPRTLDATSQTQRHGRSENLRRGWCPVPGGIVMEAKHQEVGHGTSRTSRDVTPTARRCHLARGGRRGLRAWALRDLTKRPSNDVAGPQGGLGGGTGIRELRRRVASRLPDLRPPPLSRAPAVAIVSATGDGTACSGRPRCMSPTAPAARSWWSARSPGQTTLGRPFAWWWASTTHTCQAKPWPTPSGPPHSAIWPSTSSLPRILRSWRPTSWCRRSQRRCAPPRLTIAELIQRPCPQALPGFSSGRSTPSDPTRARTRERGSSRARVRRAGPQMSCRNLLIQGHDALPCTA